MGAMTGALLFVSAALGVLSQAPHAAAFVPPTPLAAGVSTGRWVGRSVRLSMSLLEPSTKRTGVPPLGSTSESFESFDPSPAPSSFDPSPSPSTLQAATGASNVGKPTSGLNAGFQLWRRKLWTKADYLHLHAISGTLFMGLGALYVLSFLGDELFNHAAWTLAEAGRVGWLPLFILVTGVANCVTCAPMSKFTRAGLPDPKGAGFKGLGIGMTMLGCWLSYVFSGHYPQMLGALDRPLSAAFFAIIVHGIINSEVALDKELKEKGLFAVSEGEEEPTWTDGTITETRREVVLNHRVASSPNLLHLPVLYNLFAGGQGWAHKVAALFPLEPTLLFHASFGIAVANSIVFLGATLKDRKLMTLRQWLLLQVVVLTPFVTTVVDCASLGSRVSIDPFQTYAGLMP